VWKDQRYEGIDAHCGSVEDELYDGSMSISVRETREESFNGRNMFRILASSAENEGVMSELCFFGASCDNSSRRLLSGSISEKATFARLRMIETTARDPPRPQMRKENRDVNDYIIINGLQNLGNIPIRPWRQHMHYLCLRSFIKRPSKSCTDSRSKSSITPCLYNIVVFKRQHHSRILKRYRKWKSRKSLL